MTATLHSPETRRHTTRPRTILFDLDGTLVDSVAFILACANHAFEEHGGPRPTDAEWTSKIGMPLLECFRPYVASEDELAHLVSRYRAYQLERHDAITRCFEGVEETIASLHAQRHLMGIVTGKTTTLARRSLEVSGLAPYFGVVVGCDSCPEHKPDPEPVRMALRLLESEANETLFVGDSIHDMSAGRAAGVTTVAALWGAFTREMLEPASPDYFLETMTHLPALISNLPPGPGI